jgi:hypothetical protein
MGCTVCVAYVKTTLGRGWLGRPSEWEERCIEVYGSLSVR